MIRGAGLLCTLSATSACEPKTKVIPPLGEVLVVVDTDMPVPRMTNRLRIDFYTEDKVWYGSRDIARAKVTDWPTSFGLYVPDDLRERVVLVRLRAYPEGEIRDYRGERFAPKPSASWSSGAADPFELAPVAPASEQPRLITENDVDATPSTEPAPLTAIDRLIRVRVLPNVRGAARVVLRGVCVGTMADMGETTTCVDTEAQRVPVPDEAITADLNVGPSLVGAFDFREACTAQPRAPGSASDGSPLHDEEVCVDGAMFIFGSNSGFGFADANDLPKRVAQLPSFRMDRFEVTVGRWRNAMARGFQTPDSPIPNEEPIPRDGTVSGDPRSCTWSTQPVGREDYPIACLSPNAAAAFCAFEGGDLPTEVQWEYVAMHAGRPYSTPMPWGGEPGRGASCENAVFARGALPFNNECNRDGQHYGVLPVTAAIGANGDVSVGLGVVGMLASMTEVTRDAYASFSSNCWSAQPLRSPACLAPSAVRALRGASWALPKASVFAAHRASVTARAYSSEVGFRCVRSGT